VRTLPLLGEKVEDLKQPYLESRYRCCSSSYE
jgi:hypothetical protein